MSGRKSNLKQFKVVSAGNMALTSITSPVTAIEQLDNLGVQFNWTGSPVGTFQVQVSADYAQDTQGNVTNTGNWVAVPLNYLLSGVSTSATTVPTSAGSPIYLDLNQLSAPWMRSVYTKSSGTGSVDMWVTGKMI